MAPNTENSQAKNSDHDGTKRVQDIEKHFEVEIWDF